MTTRSVIIRAIKTFLQSLIALLGLDGIGWLNATTSKQVVAATVAAGLSAAMNVIYDLEQSLGQANHSNRRPRRRLADEG